MTQVAPLARDAGTLIRSPDQDDAEWWAGAPSALSHDGHVFLAYRMRAPRPRRGHALRIASSDDGFAFRDIWELPASALGAASLERACLTVERSTVRLYLSYVDRADGRWRIGVIEGERPERLDPRARRAALTPGEIGVEGVKDPVVIRDGDRWTMLMSVAPGTLDARAHATGDVFATGLARSCTGLATSDDGLEWRWEGLVLVPPPSGWDAFETRIASVYRARGRWVALYDGIATAEQNYAERTGLAVSADLRDWRRETSRGPALEARYCEVLRHDGRTLLYFEAPRPSGAHELRVAQAIVAVDTDRMGGR